MSMFLRKLREFIVGTDAGEGFPPTLPMADEVQGKIAYQGTVCLYESRVGAEEPYHYLLSGKVRGPDKLLGKTSVTFLLDKDFAGGCGLRKVPQGADSCTNWLEALKKGADKREELIKRIGKDYG